MWEFAGTGGLKIAQKVGTGEGDGGAAACKIKIPEEMVCIAL